MDRLSEEKVPFFFMIDFLAENIEISSEKDLESSQIKFDFQVNKNNKKLPKNFGLTSFPPTKEDYKKGFEMVQKHLQKGNSYLINYTKKTEIETNLSLEEIFEYSEAKYKILYPNHFVCFSPETFIKIIDNQVFTYPMKGTIDADIDNATELLKNDKKEKAEHYTVVDLLRNDLSQIADNVQVTDFQRIDFIRTKQKNLYAMSSEILGRIKPKFQNKIGSILQKLVPAGSILGAPKPKTLEIILEAENYDRGWYTGICGWFDGKNLDSCVMIRFIEKEGEKLYFKSGGGITHMSQLDDEYEEMKNKIYVPIY
ncbi:MAG: aminodeoxychorismate synthase component I [Bergeyella zoohelcum]|nr:aminodeoxychorismate synthase component I [Bergeyella zoohelcum]